MILYHDSKLAIYVAEWRNRHGTAFVEVHVSHHTDRGLVHYHWQAKSQGPTAGGFNKAAQARERLLNRIGYLKTTEKDARSPEAFVGALVDFMRTEQGYL